MQFSNVTLDAPSVLAYTAPPLADAPTTPFDVKLTLSSIIKY
jgi:hypothetical protein